nr:immunoglobulin heavy chain junction region [Macaca mulatta]MOW22423.1 immunoglobulin heavy chain junction region [Macaca mulatta]
CVRGGGSGYYTDVDYW